MQWVGALSIRPRVDETLLARLNGAGCVGLSGTALATNEQTIANA